MRFMRRRYPKSPIAAVARARDYAATAGLFPKVVRVPGFPRARAKVCHE
jgi:hypothetical protein